MRRKFLRPLWMIDLLGSIFLMIEASYYDNKIIGGIALIFILLCFWFVSKIKSEETL